MKTRTLPLQLTVACGQYFLNSQLSHKQLVCTTVSPSGRTEEWKDGRSWNKNEDLERIANVCRKLKWGFQACAGTFWFIPIVNKRTHYKTHKDIWPLVEICKNK